MEQFQRKLAFREKMISFSYTYKRIISELRLFKMFSSTSKTNSTKKRHKNFTIVDKQL